MAKSGLPAYYYPVSSVFVDRSQDFLTYFTRQLDQQLFAYSFTSTVEALAWLKKTKRLTTIRERSVKLNEELVGNPITNQTITLDLEEIYKEIYNPKRFSEIAVIIVNYDLEGLNGIEFLEKLKHQPVKKILISSKIRKEEVYDAFNRGIIDSYINKTDRDVLNKINDTIHELQRQFFYDTSEEIRTILLKDQRSFITDPIFAEFFVKFCQKHNIVEYYLLELTGTFLLLDGDANTSYLVVKCYEDLHLHYEFAQDNGAPESVLQAIRGGEKIPFTANSDDYFNLQDTEEWLTHIYPAEELKGKFNTYYYSYIPNLASDLIDSKRIYSYNTHLLLTHSSSRESV